MSIYEDDGQVDELDINMEAEKLLYERGAKLQALIADLETE